MVEVFDVLLQRAFAEANHVAHNIWAMPDFWGFICIPIVAAVVTWAHVWIAIKMMFYPVDFIGHRPPWFGWQGIVPRKGRKMGEILVDKTISKIGSVGDFLRQMEPDKIAEHVAGSVASRIEEYVDEVVNERHQVLWENLPRIVRLPVYEHARRNLPQMMDALVRDIIEDIDNLVDVKAMVGNQLDADRKLVVRMFEEVGDRELKFIVNVSFWIGLGFGFVQMVLWYFWPVHLMLPIYAAVLGLLTNWIAISLIFRPLNPIYIGPIRVQGLFLRRQPEVAEKFAAIAAHEILTVGRFMREILTGKRAERTRVLIRKHLAPVIEAPAMRTIAQIAIGPHAYADLKTTIATKSVEIALDPLSDEAFNRDRAIVLSRLFSEKIRALTPAEFQDLLRPAFHEDEWILLLLGAITGLAAGWGQLIVGFS